MAKRENNKKKGGRRKRISEKLKNKEDRRADLYIDIHTMRPKGRRECEETREKEGLRGRRKRRRRKRETEDASLERTKNGRGRERKWRGRRERERKTARR